MPSNSSTEPLVLMLKSAARSTNDGQSSHIFLENHCFQSGLPAPQTSLSFRQRHGCEAKPHLRQTHQHSPRGPEGEATTRWGDQSQQVQSCSKFVDRWAFSSLEVRNGRCQFPDRVVECPSPSGARGKLLLRRLKGDGHETNLAIYSNPLKDSGKISRRSTLRPA